MSYSKVVEPTNNIALDIVWSKAIPNLFDYLPHIRNVVDQIGVISRNHLGAAQFDMDLDTFLDQPEFSARYKRKFDAKPGMIISYSALSRNQVMILGHVGESSKVRYMDLDLALSEFVLAAMVAEFHQEPCDCLGAMKTEATYASD